MTYELYSPRYGPIPARFYRATKDEAYPLLVYFHGGSFMLGTLTLYVPRRRLAVQADAPCCPCTIVWRRRPHFRRGAERLCRDAMGRDHAPLLNIDASKIAVGGAPAGNLAAMVAQMAQDSKNSPRRCRPVYPITDHSREYPSTSAMPAATC